VLDWRLNHTSLLHGRDGLLPWLPGIPNRIAADPTWGPYLNARLDLVTQLADEVRRNCAANPAAWATQLHTLLPGDLIADVQVWRAASQIHLAICYPPGHPSSAAPPESSNSNSTNDSPLLLRMQMSDGGKCSPQMSNV
jgi:hypothetical protein